MWQSAYGYYLTSRPTFKQKIDLTANLLVFLVVGCIVATALLYMICERLMVRAGVIEMAPVFSKEEMLHTYRVTLIHYKSLCIAGSRIQGTVGPLCHNLLARAYGALVHVRARISQLMQRRSLLRMKRTVM